MLIKFKFIIDCCTLQFKSSWFLYFIITYIRKRWHLPLSLNHFKAKLNCCFNRSKVKTRCFSREALCHLQNLTYYNLDNKIFYLNKNQIKLAILVVPRHKCRKRTHCVKSVQIRSFFWSAFCCIRTEYENLRSKSLHSVRIQENTYLDTFHAVIRAVINLCSFPQSNM